MPDFLRRPVLGWFDTWRRFGEPLTDENVQQIYLWDSQTLRFPFDDQLLDLSGNSQPDSGTGTHPLGMPRNLPAQMHGGGVAALQPCSSTNSANLLVRARWCRAKSLNMMRLLGAGNNAQAIVHSLGGWGSYIVEGSGGVALQLGDPPKPGPYLESGLTISGWIIAEEAADCAGCFTPLVSCSDQVGPCISFNYVVINMLHLAIAAPSSCFPPAVVTLSLLSCGCAAQLSREVNRHVNFLMTEYSCFSQDGASFGVHVGKLGVTVSKGGQILLANADAQDPMDIKGWTFVVVDISLTAGDGGEAADDGGGAAAEDPADDGAGVGVRRAGAEEGDVAIKITVHCQQTQPYITISLHFLVSAHIWSTSLSSPTVAPYFCSHFSSHVAISMT